MSVLAILLLLASLPAGAQGAAGAQTGQAPRAARTAQAILDRGPIPVRGLPFFPPNVLQAVRGQYVVEENRVVMARIEVCFTREPLVLPSSWRKAPCGPEALLRVEGEENPTFCYQEPEGGYALFLSFEGEAFPWCSWTQAFLQGLRSLLAFSQGTGEVPFPALLQYRY